MAGELSRVRECAATRARFPGLMPIHHVRGGQVEPSVQLRAQPLCKFRTDRIRKNDSFSCHDKHGVMLIVLRAIKARLQLFDSARSLRRGAAGAEQGHHGPRGDDLVAHRFPPRRRSTEFELSTCREATSRQERTLGGFSASSTMKRSVSRARKWIDAFKLSMSCELMSGRASTSRIAASATRASFSTAAKNAALVFGNSASTAVAQVSITR